MANEPLGPVAHLYARISTEEQRKGGGLERQTSESTVSRVGEFCRRYGFTLASRVRVDDGVSAWKGLNASPDHELGKFLADARRGLIRRGDCLILENWDRLSRQNIWAATSLVNDLRELGINIGRLDRGKMLRYDSSDPGDFFDTVIELMRGNSESTAKSERNGAAWGRKRSRAREFGAMITRRLPAWIKEVDGELILIQERAAAIRRVFALACSGYGTRLIVKQLTAEGIPAFGAKEVCLDADGNPILTKHGKLQHRAPTGQRLGSGHWAKSYVELLLKDPRVLGTFQPCKIDGTEDGPPITGYFPRVIDDNMFHAVATGLKDRRKRPGRVSERIELFSGLLRNARDHDTYYATTRNDRSGLKYRVLINTKSANGSVKCYSFPSQTFEECILASLREVDPLQILASADTPDETLALAGELATIEAKIAALEAELLNGDVAALARVLRVLEEKKRDIAAKLAEARGRAASPLSESWGECKSILETLASAPDVKDARLRLRGVLRRIITDIWLMVVPRGILRTCAVQVFFAEGGRRDYWLLHRGRHNGRQERFVSLSVREGSILDLRTADGADKMRQQLESLTKDQINSLIAHGAELA